MRKIVMLFFVLLAVPSFTFPAFGQAAQAAAREAHYYHLDFVVKELGDDGRVINSREYGTTISTDKMSSVRAGTRVPLRTNDEKGDIQYIDIGVNIDCNQVHETPEGLALNISANISSLASSVGSGDTSDPIIRQNSWQSAAMLPMGKPTLVFSSDNLENKGKMEVEVTAEAIQ